MQRKIVEEHKVYAVGSKKETAQEGREAKQMKEDHSAYDIHLPRHLALGSSHRIGPEYLSDLSSNVNL